MNDKLDEIKKILSKKVIVNTSDTINDILKKYKNDLIDFKYIENPKYFLEKKKNKYIRYVGFNGKINYGGFLIKTEKKNNTVYLYLINKHKQVWYLDFNKNYIFVSNILTKNEIIRKEFEMYLSKLNL